VGQRVRSGGLNAKPPSNMPMKTTVVAAVISLREDAADSTRDAIVTAETPSYEFHQPGFWGSRLVRCRLEDGELIVEVEGKPPLSIPYHDVTAVQLSSRAHGRNEALMQVRDFRCRVTAGRQVVEITNRSDRGVGHRYRYENRAFRSFVNELHRRLLPFQDRVRFHSGHKLYFGLVAGLGTLAAILAPFRLASYEDHLAFGIATYLAAVTGLWVAASQLRPRSYSPTKIPEGLLPAGESHPGFIA
jgi:hypothetical protein